MKEKRDERKVQCAQMCAVKVACHLLPYFLIDAI
jgi:hypothetical protein